MTSHLRLSWFSNTGIDVRFSLKAFTYMVPRLLWSLHPPFPSLLSASTAKPGRPLLLSPSSILGWDQHQSATGQGSAQSLFQLSLMQRASTHSCPLWCYSGLIHGLTYSCCEIALPQRCFPWHNPWDKKEFLHQNCSISGKHFPVQEIYCIRNRAQHLECGDVSTFHDQT